MDVDSDDRIVEYFDDTLSDPKEEIPYLAKGVGRVAKMILKIKKILKKKKDDPKEDPLKRDQPSRGPTLRRCNTEGSTIKRGRT